MQSKLPMHTSRRCEARTRSGQPCQSGAMTNGRCRMHGGPSPGAPEEIGTLSSTGDTQPKRVSGGAKSRPCCATSDSLLDSTPMQVAAVIARAGHASLITREKRTRLADDHPRRLDC